MNVEISGNLRGPTVFFVAGWPDSSDVFRTNLMAQLSKDYRIVGITMPGYSDASPFMRAYRERFAEARRAKEQYDTERREGEARRRAQRRSLWARGRATYRIAVRFVTRGHGLPFMNADVDDDDDEGCEDDDDEEDKAGLVRYQLENNDEPMRTPLFGYGFQDLVRLLEIAIDSAMEMHNECPFAFLATSINDGRGTVQGTPAHQLAPFYSRPMMVAHGWGVQLVFELLLSRPTYFSRIVALDAGAAVFERPQPHATGTRAQGMAGSSAGQSSPAETPHSPQTPRQATTPATCGTVNDSSRLGRALGTSQPSVSPLPAPVDAAHRDRHRGSREEPRRARGLNHSINEGSHMSTPRTTPQPVTRSATSIFPAQTHSKLNDIDAFMGDGGFPPRLDGGSRDVSRQRSLASRYAIRPRQTNAVKTTNVRNRWQSLGVFVFQLLIIACTFTIPRFLARWILFAVLWVARRPRYTTNPHVVLTPETEAFNQKLYQQDRFQRSYPRSNSAMGVSALAQSRLTDTCHGGRHSGVWEDGIGSFSDGDDRFTLSQTDDDNPHRASSRMLANGAQPVPTPPRSLAGGFRVPATGGWHVVLIPFLRSPHFQDEWHGVCQRGSSRLLYRTSFSQPSQAALEIGVGTADASRHAGDARGSVALSRQRVPRRADALTEGGRTGIWDQHGGSRGGGEAARGTTIDVGFAKVDGIEAYGVVQDNMLESITGVSPYHAYRQARHAMYDSAVPSGVWQRHSDGGGGEARLPARVPRWSPEGAGCASKQHMLWRRKEVYYRSFIIPPSPEDVWQEEDAPAEGGELRSASSSSKRRRGATKKGGRGGGRKERAAEVQSTMGWIYLQYWWGVTLSILFSPSSPQKPPTQKATGEGGRAPSPRDSSPTASPYSPLVSQRFFFPVAVPVLFMYGANKPFMLHSAQWCDYVKNEKRAEDGISDVVEVQGGGHWFFAEKKHQKKVAERVAEFMAAKSL